MIAFILLCILLGILLAGIIAPVIAVRNQRTLHQMKSILEQADIYPNTGDDTYYEWRRSLIGSLYDMKSQIMADKRSLTQADDYIERFKNITS